MKYGDKHMIHTDIYKPNPEKACEACCFGRGEHAAWCEAELDEMEARHSRDAEKYGAMTYAPRAN